MRRRSSLTAISALVLGLLTPAPQLDAAEPEADVSSALAIENCPLVAPADAPYAFEPFSGDIAPFSPMAASDAPGLRDRIDFWAQVWGDAGDNVVFLVDGRRPEIVHAVVECESGDRATGQAPDKAACDRRVGEASRDVKNGLRQAKNARRHPAQERYQGQRALLKDAASHVRAVRGRRDAMARAVTRAAPYINELETIFVANGVPASLSRLAIVESLFRPGATSRAGATGAYQFTRSTGAMFLTIDDRIDERLDVLRAGNAAAKYLGQLHRQFGRWDLALTAYNTGPSRVRRAMRAHGTTDLARIVDRNTDSRFGFDGQNYYAQVAATIALSEHLMVSSKGAAPSYAVVKTAASAHALARCLNSAPEAFLDVNPAIHGAAIDHGKHLAVNTVVAVPSVPFHRVVMNVVD